MKNLIVVFTLIFITSPCCILYSQSQQPFINYITDTTTTGKYRFFIHQGTTVDSNNDNYVIHSLNGSDSTLSILTKIDKNGQLLWRKPILPFSYNGIVHTQFSYQNKLFEDVDGNIVFITKGADIAACSTECILLFKFDLNGNLLTRNFYPISFNYKIREVIPESNGNIMITGYNIADDNNSNIFFYGFDKNFISNFSNSIALTGSPFQYTDLQMSNLLINNNSLTFSYIYGCNGNCISKVVQYNKSNFVLNWNKIYSNDPLGNHYYLSDFQNNIYIIGNGYKCLDYNGNIIKQKNYSYFLNNKIDSIGHIKSINNSSTINQLIDYNLNNDSVIVIVNNQLTDLKISHLGLKSKNSIWNIGSYYYPIDSFTLSSKVKKFFFEKFDTSNNITNIYEYKIPDPNWNQLNIKETYFDKNNNLIILLHAYGGEVLDTIINQNVNADIYILLKIEDQKQSEYLEGTIFVDSNSNCTYNDFEMKVSQNLVYTLPDSSFSISNSTGKYKIANKNKVNSINITPINNYNFCNSQKKINIDTNNIAIDSLNFAYVFDSLMLKNSANINIYHSPARPGFTQENIINVNNNSILQILNSSIVKVKIDSQFQIINTIPLADSINNNFIFWHINNLNPKGVLQFNASVIVPANIPIGTLYSNYCTLLI